MDFRTVAIAGLGAAALAGCNTAGDLVVEEGVGITALRSVCPAVGVPDYTGAVTLFSPAGAVTADALDVTATLTNVTTTCDDSSERVYAQANFEVLGQRRDTRGARTVELPYFATVVQGGSNVVSKRVGRVALRFADGEYRASTSGAATGQVLRSAATLPEEIRREITRERKPGDADAALDPMADPEVRAAVQRASFELLVGFQLTQDQLRYNATR